MLYNILFNFIWKKIKPFFLLQTKKFEKGIVEIKAKKSEYFVFLVLKLKWDIVLSARTDMRTLIGLLEALLKPRNILIRLNSASTVLNLLY